MRRNLPELVFLALCFLLCLVPVAGMLLRGPETAGANETLAAPPRLQGEDGPNAEFLNDLSAYVSDHFFLRKSLITLHNRLETLGGNPVVGDVIAGRDGWLYYLPTLEDYTGIRPMSEPELWSAARNLSLVREYCGSRGAELLFVIAPNKNSLYPDRMPDFGTVAPEHDAQRLFRLLDAEGVPYLDLFRLFSAQEKPLYFDHDSHWNSAGAALAADAVLHAFGRPSDWFSGSFSPGETHQGDLYEMLYPAAQDTERDLARAAPPRFRRLGKDTRPDSISIRTEGEGTGSLLAFRDSFGNLLFPYLAESFASAQFSRGLPYRLTALEELSDCTVLIELVERNLDYLVTYAPVMPAPERPPPPVSESAGTVELAPTEGTGTLPGYREFRGTLPAGSAGASPVYLLRGGNAYEAFTLSGGGFSAFLPEGGLPEQVVYRADGGLKRLEIIFGK